jgi:hypothetical protein
MQFRESSRAFAARQADGGVPQGMKLGVLAPVQGTAAGRVQSAAGGHPRGRDLPAAGCREWSWTGRPPGHQGPSRLSC